MNKNRILGIEIGNYRVKIAYVVHGQMMDFFSEVLPENVVKNGLVRYQEAFSDFLKKELKQHGLSCRNAVFSIPMSSYFIRRVKIPKMTIAQLKVNLPFEFHDYISEESAEYVYDYAVLGEDDKYYDILATACPLDTVQSFQRIAHACRLNLAALVPDVIGIQRMTRHYDELMNHPEHAQDYVIVDAGEIGFRVHFFNHGLYETTRNIDPGIKELIEIASNSGELEPHVARRMIETNENNILADEQIVDAMQSDAVQIMRAINFYSFNNSGNNIDAVYLCGGGSQMAALKQVLELQLTLPVKLVNELYPDISPEIAERAALSPTAYGVAL